MGRGETSLSQSVVLKEVLEYFKNNTVNKQVGNLSSQTKKYRRQKQSSIAFTFKTKQKVSKKLI